MYNFNNLSDVDFEILCKDIMQKKLGTKLYTFQKGRDGGIDITDNPSKRTVVIQVKHYINSTYSNLISSLKKEVEKVEKLQPEKYYVCCAVKLTDANKREIYDLFSDYMESANDIMSLGDINDFLEESENVDIVRKHYKLWLESTNILSEIMNQSIFIDCESLLYNIEESSKEFVETNCYFECLDILERERMLLLLGMPGTGKTVTTKMLALYYAAKGYRIRYTTNGDIRDLKSALSAQKDLPEVLLLDDCLGQHYFKMKETQGNELIGLIKYITMNKNKKLIMNSRVTIFQQAKECFIELKQFTEDKKIKIQILDMNQISIPDKGRIFYNHIYFKNLPIDYYQDILRNHNYRKIVMHNNYTPRIMEFVTRDANYRNVDSKHYFEYVMRCLDNPTEIWQDEFLEKLQQEDRMFLTTLYSLTDTSVDEDTIKRAFNYRLKNAMTMDTTRNVWEDVLKRLEGSLIIIIEKNKKKEIGVINPSVNDFLKEYLQKNDIERESIKENATEYEQIKRGFAGNIEDIVRAGKADLYNYANPNERLYVILSYVCRLGVLDDNYRNIVESFFEEIPFGWFEGTMSRCKIFLTLLSGKFSEFYDTYAWLDDSKVLGLFHNMDLDEYEDFIIAAKDNEIDFFYTKYRDIFIETINTAIVEYMEDIAPDDYYSTYDIDDLLKENIKYNGLYEEVDKEEVIRIICDWIEEDVEQVVYEKIMELPTDIRREVKVLRRNISVYITDIESYIDSYFEPSGFDDDFREIEYDYGGTSEMDILDSIFK